jgi:hypothetical protein
MFFMWSSIQRVAGLLLSVPWYYVYMTEMPFIRLSAALAGKAIRVKLLKKAV